MTTKAQETQPPAVYGAICEVSGAIAKHGIAKGRTNSAQGFKFRGIDDVYNALAPILAAARLCILPRVLTREHREVTTAKGSVMAYVTVAVEFDLVSAVDGSRHTVSTFGEAMDTADKATNKAMSAAYKYMAMQAFCIPTEGDNDADATSPEPTRPTAADNAARRATHDESWPAQQAGFFARLTGLGIDHDMLCRWCVSLDRPRPSQMQPLQREAMLAALQTASNRAKFDAFLEANSKPVTETK